MPRPPDGPVRFFIDDCLGCEAVARAVREGGHLVVEYSEIGLTRTDFDDVWMPKVAAAGIPVITKDMNLGRAGRSIRDHHLELLKACRLGAFILNNASMSGAELAAAVSTALPAMVQRWRKTSPPFVYAITRKGEIEPRVQGERRGAIKRR